MIIMLTAFDEFGYVKQSLSIGAVEYLLKPLKPSDLCQTLSEVLTKVEQLKRKQQEEVEIRKNLEEAMPYIQMSFVYDLVSGTITNSQFRDRAKFLGIKTDPNVVLLATIYNFQHITRNQGEPKKQVLKQQVYRHVQAMLGTNALVTPLGGDEIIILLGYDNENSAEYIKKRVIDTARGIRESVSQALGIGLTICIGRYCGDSLEIHKSYLDAVGILRQRFFNGENQITHIEDLSHLNTPIHYPFHYERNLLDKVRCGERKSAKEALKCLLDEIFESGGSNETIKACILELLVVLSRAAAEGGANIDQLTLLNFDFINHLMGLGDWREVTQLVMEVVDRFMDNMLENRSTLNTRVINKACEYIVQNCKKNLSLEEVANSVHLSPFYFSRVFKAEKSCNFIDYLTKIRIDKAKRLLRSFDQTVTRIALEVGYQDVSYFCRVFRQEEGVTPNQYRSTLKT
jgi:two-component system response regulator YesN